MPASDVYGWAKQANKPDYTASEVGAAPSSHVSNKNNPHGVTASQTGAIAKTDKPSGTYTGTGTHHTETIGGTGKCVLVWSEDETTNFYSAYIFTPAGVLSSDTSNGNGGYPYFYDKNWGFFNNGTLNLTGTPIQNTPPPFNAKDRVYYYQVL